MGERFSSKTRTLFTSNLPTDVMQLSTLSAQLGLASELIGWSRDATSLPYGHFLIDLSRTNRRSTTLLLKYWVHSLKILYLRRIEASQVFGRHTHKISVLYVFQLFIRKCKSHFLQTFPKDFIRFLCQCIVILLKGNLQSTRRHHVAKFHSEIRLVSLSWTTWKQRNEVLASEKGLQLIKGITPLVINRLSWCGAVPSRRCFYSQRAWLPRHLQIRNSSNI